MKSKIGLIGLAVMGANLARNIADKGFKTSVFNRTTKVTDEFINKFGNDNLLGFSDLKEFVDSIEKPRKIIIMVKAGKAVDLVIENLMPLLDKEDIIIDCGNSNFEDTIRRTKELEKKNLNFFGCGVSGGEEGALNGPSLMPGGNQNSFLELKNIFDKIAAKDFNNRPCVTYIGNDGAGHYVKMVHNGIEYAIMEMLAEAYDLLRNIYFTDANKIADIFSEYNKSKLKSYLFEIMVPVLKKKDDKQGGFLIDKILDQSAQKGTGIWTVLDATKRFMSVSTIYSAVIARVNSNEKESRIKLNNKFNKEKTNIEIPLNDFIKILEDALYLSILIAYAEGYELMKKASKDQNWDLNLKEISRIWQGGCIIRSEILRFLEDVYKKEDNLHFLEIPQITYEFKNKISSLRKITNIGIKNNIPVSAFCSAMNYFDTMTNRNLPANLIQGLRDYFGAHTYKRVDMDGDFHTEWEEHKN
jgi:6-phosphogluconate dehydrogenase